MKCFPGVSADRLHHYMLYDLLEDRKDVVIIHVGSNSMLSNQEPQDIADGIFKVALTCMDYGVRKVVISGIITRWNGIAIERKRREINDILKQLCDISDEYLYMCNDNIVLDDIENKPWDRVHLTREGEGGLKLVNNVVEVLNSI